MDKRYVVVMAGGRGERFWPESRLDSPKQLLPIVGEVSMLAQTLNRLKGLVEPENILVIVHSRQRAAALKACPEVAPDRIIGEPVGRDTAATIALATMLVRREDPEGVFAVLPADAVIKDAAGFVVTIEKAFQIAEASPLLVTIGVPPTSPATGYGYLQKGKKRAGGEATGFDVERFIEKPSQEKAQIYYKESGNYFWNAGIFVWSVGSIAAEIEKSMPDLWMSLQAIDSGLDSGVDLNHLLADLYPSLEKDSIDYAVMEKASGVVMVEADFDWDDVGEWTALARHYAADSNGNVIRGSAHLQQSSDNIVFSSRKGHLVALLGVEDLVVVESDGVTLVCCKNKIQELKALVENVGVEHPHLV